MSKLIRNNDDIVKEQDDYKVEDPEEQYLESLISKVVEILRDDGVYVPESHVSFMGQLLRVTDYSVEGAAKLAVKARDAILILYDELRDYTPSRYYHHFGSQGIFKVLKGRDELGRCVAVFHWGKWNPEELNFSEVIAGLTFFFQWIHKESPVTQRNGTVLVNDMTDFGLKQLRGMDIGLMKKIIPLGQSHAPAKIGGLHYIFAPRIFDYTYYVLRPFIVEHLRNNIHFHSQLATFHQYVKPEILPNCLGGTLGEVEAVHNEVHRTFAEGGAEFFQHFAMDAVADAKKL